MKLKLRIYEVQDNHIRFVVFENDRQCGNLVMSFKAFVLFSHLLLRDGKDWPNDPTEFVKIEDCELMT